MTVCTHGNFIRLTHCETRPPTPYPTQSHYPRTGPTSHCPILILNQCDSALKVKSDRLVFSLFFSFFLLGWEGYCLLLLPEIGIWIEPKTEYIYSFIDQPIVVLQTAELTPHSHTPSNYPSTLTYHIICLYRIYTSRKNYLHVFKSEKETLWLFVEVLCPGNSYDLFVRLLLFYILATSKVIWPMRWGA